MNIKTIDNNVASFIITYFQYITPTYNQNILQEIGFLYAMYSNKLTEQGSLLGTIFD
jgi:hypothetical protein